MDNIFDDINLATDPEAPSSAQPSAGNIFDDINLSGEAPEAPPAAAPASPAPNKGSYKMPWEDEGEKSEWTLRGLKKGIKQGVEEAINPFNVKPESQKEALSTYSGTAGYLVGNILSSLGVNAGLTAATAGTAGAVGLARQAKTASNIASALYAAYQGLGRDKIRREGDGEEWKPFTKDGATTALLSTALELNPLLKVSGQIAPALQIGARTLAQGVGEAGLEKMYGGDNNDATIAAALGMLGAGATLYGVKKAGEASEETAKKAAQNMLDITSATAVEGPELMKRTYSLLGEMGTERPPEAPTEFMRYVVGDKDAKLGTKTLAKAYETRLKQYGPQKLDELYTMMQTEKALSQAVGESVASDLSEISRGAVKDVNPLRRFALPVFYVSRQVDEATGLDTSKMRDLFGQAHQVHNNVSKYFVDKLKPLHKEAKSLGLSGEDVFHLVTKEDDGKYKAVVDKLKGNTEFETKIKDFTDSLLSYLEEQGYSPARRKNYLPAKTLSRGKLVDALEAGVEELPSLLKKEGLTMEGVRGELASIKKAIQKDPKQAGALKEFKDQYRAAQIIDTLDKVGEKMGVGPVRDVASWAEMKNQLLKGGRLDITDELTDVSALFRRKGEIPSMIRERDAFRLLSGYINENLRAAHFDKAMRYGQMYTRVLDGMGLQKTSELFKNYITDQAGGARGLAGVLKNINTRLDYEGTKRLRTAQSQLDKALGYSTEAIPEFVSWLNSKVYTSKLALNVPGWVRNFTQFAATTVPELGMRYGVKKALQATRNFIKDEQKVKGLVKELKDKGLISDFGRLETSHFGQALGGVKGKLDKVDEIMFLVYKGTDTFNRAITWKMGKEVAADIMKSEQPALKFVQSMDKGAKQRINNIMSSSLDPRQKLEELHDVVGRYLINKTQFDYSAANKAEWARLAGPYFSMFTTWPGMIAGDVDATLKEKGVAKGAAKLMAKYFPLYGLALVAERAIEDENDGVMNYLLNDMSSWTPFDSIVPDDKYNARSGLLKNPMMEMAAEVGKPLVTAPLKAVTGDFEGAANSLKSAGRGLVTKGATTYAPIVGPVLNELDRMHRARTGKKLTTEISDELGLKKENK